MPRCEQRYNPYGAAYQIPKTIIIHAMGEYVAVSKDEYEYAPDYLMRQGLSAHALIAPNGTIYRCRQDDQGAYHALGNNTDTLGIEIMAEGKHDYSSFAHKIKTPYLTDEQYASLLWQCCEWCKLYKIKKIVRHMDLSPGRKIDPGLGFPMAQFLSDLEKEVA